MSASETFPFAVEVRDRATGRASADTSIAVLDGRDEPRGEGVGHVALELPRGLYAIQVERAGTREERVHRHDGPTSLVLDEPQRFSAVPANDTATSHEYYQGPAIQWSGEETAPPLPGPVNRGSLFIFLRAASLEAAQPLDGLRLRISGHAGFPPVEMDAAVTRRDESTGWLAFHVEAPAGEYVLRYAPADARAPAREMAIAVFEQWQTQVFMTLRGGRPSFASASVLLGRGGFRPDDRVAQAVDAALAGLQNGEDLLVPEQRETLLHGKFDNPMLGLVGAHALLHGGDADPGTMSTVVGNLSYLLRPDAPDIRALRLIMDLRAGDPVDGQPFEHPPMLRAGLEAVLSAAASHPGLVPPGGMLAAIALERFVDSPWSTWRPLPEPDATEAPGSAGSETGATWVTRYIEDAAEQAARSHQEIDLPEIAARVSLPLASVAGAYEEIRALMEPGPERTDAMERLVARSRRDAKVLDLDQESARSLFYSGRSGARVEAIGLMQGDEEIQDFDVALTGISDSQSAFEQYHALRLARQMVPGLDGAQREQLADAVSRQRGPDGWIEEGMDRWSLSGRLLADLGVTG